MCRRWTEEELEILKRESPYKTSVEIGEILNRSPAAIISQASKHKVKLESYRIKFTNKEIKELKTLTYTASEFSLKFNRNKSFVLLKARELGLKLPKEVRIKPEVKTCSRCEESFPRTLEFFFSKKSYNKNKTISYAGFRSVCKTCHSKKTLDRNRQKRCKELNCSIEDYRESYLKGMGSKHKKYPYLDNVCIPLKEVETIRKRIRKGYVFTSYDQYKKDQKTWVHERLKEKSKYNDLPDGYMAYKDLPTKLLKEVIGKREPTEGTLANWLGYKTGQLPKEVLDTKRLIVAINKEAKNQQ